jgi:hypothetical protein
MALTPKKDKKGSHPPGPLLALPACCSRATHVQLPGPCRRGQVQLLSPVPPGRDGRGAGRQRTTASDVAGPAPLNPADLLPLLARTCSLLSVGGHVAVGFMHSPPSLLQGGGKQRQGSSSGSWDCRLPRDPVCVCRWPFGATHYCSTGALAESTACEAQRQHRRQPEPVLLPSGIPASAQQHTHWRQML